MYFSSSFFFKKNQENKRKVKHKHTHILLSPTFSKTQPEKNPERTTTTKNLNNKKKEYAEKKKKDFKIKIIKENRLFFFITLFFLPSYILNIFKFLFFFFLCPPFHILEREKVLLFLFLLFWYMFLNIMDNYIYVFVFFLFLFSFLFFRKERSTQILYIYTDILYQYIPPSSSYHREKKS